MRYYLDCEFNGMGGELLSLALVWHDPAKKAVCSFYVINSAPTSLIDKWVCENVLPLMQMAPDPIVEAPVHQWPGLLQQLLHDDKDVTIITDWPDDIKYFCELIITGPGTMIEVRPSIKFEMHRVDAYPTTLPGAIQHNAYWDAMALRHKLTQSGA